MLGSGTAGDGCLLEQWGRRGVKDDPPPLKVGDVVALEIEGIGRVENTVVPGVERLAVPPARRRSDREES